MNSQHHDGFKRGFEARGNPQAFVHRSLSNLIYGISALHRKTSSYLEFSQNRTAGSLLIETLEFLELKGAFL